MTTTWKLDTDPVPRRSCAKCGATMQDFGHECCAVCTYGRSFNDSPEAARRATEAHAKRRGMRAA
jgi:hypothetical protein